MNRRGYTLVEMLISLVLVVTLMSAAWGLTSLYNRFLTAGRAQALDQQIARSMFQLIDDDIGLVSLPVRPRQTQTELTAGDDSSRDSSSFQAESGSGELPESSESGSGVFSGFMNELANQNLDLPPLEFTGSATELRMTLVLPVDSRSIQANTLQDRSLGELSSTADRQTELQTDTSRLVTVVYQFQAPGLTTDFDQQLAAGLHRIEIPTLQLRQLTSSSRFEPSNSPDLQGSSSRQLVPSGEIDRFTLESLITSPPTIEAAGDDEFEALPEPRHEHIAEVVHFEFEYFNGATWDSSWGSADTLPTAVRVRFGLVSADELQTIATVFADASEQPKATTRPASDETVDPLSAIKPRRFERIFLLSSEEPPESTGDFIGVNP